MQIDNLIERVASICGLNDPTEKLRMAYLISLSVDHLSELANDEVLAQCCRDVALRLQSATDQHLAISDELEQLADSQPCEFTPEHVWALVRAIKIQSRFLELYQGA
jgi:hypothetical protein